MTESVFLDALAAAGGASRAAGAVSPSETASSAEVPSSDSPARIAAECFELKSEVFDFIVRSGAGMRARGLFVDAGSRFGALNRLARPFLGPGLLLTQSGRSVPFEVTFENQVAPDGVVELVTERVIHFGSRSERFVDALRPGGAPGTLLNYLGERRTVEIELVCAANNRGEFVMRSRRAWLRLAGLRVWLPRALSVAARSVDGFDETTGKHTIDVSVRSPIIGTVLRYRGSFTLL